MNALLIDDEQPSHDVLSHLLAKEHPEIHIQGYAYSVAEGLACIAKLQPDLVFLDFDMPDGNGFELLDQIEQPDFQVIFVTGFNQYAQTAISLGALDYLTKPVNTDKLKTAVLKAKVRQLEVRVEQMEHMQNTIASMEKNELPILTYISTSSGLLSFSTENIIYIQGISQGCVEIVVKDDNRKLVVTAAMRDYEIALKPFTRFVRVHRSYIVNLFQMRKYTRSAKPSLEMINGKLIPVSKTYKYQLVQKMGQLGMRL